MVLVCVPGVCVSHNGTGEGRRCASGTAFSPVGVNRKRLLGCAIVKERLKTGFVERAVDYVPHSTVGSKHDGEGERRGVREGLGDPPEPVYADVVREPES